MTRRPRTTTETEHNDSRILRPQEAARFLGVGRSTLYFWCRQNPDFPRPRKLGSRAAGWVMSDLLDWVASRPAGGPHAG